MHLPLAIILAIATFFFAPWYAAISVFLVIYYSFEVYAYFAHQAFMRRLDKFKDLSPAERSASKWG